MCILYLRSGGPVVVILCMSLPNSVTTAGELLKDLNIICDLKFGQPTNLSHMVLQEIQISNIETAVVLLC